MTRRWIATALSVLIIPTTLVAGPVEPASATLAPVQVVTGESHTCALAPSGQAYCCGLTGAGAAWCWGYNGDGELGDSTATSRSIPVAVQQAAVTFTSITAGNAHT